MSFGVHVVKCTILEPDEPVQVGEIRLVLDEGADEDRAIEQDLLQRYWFLNPLVCGNPIQSSRLMVAPGVDVSFHSFGEIIPDHRLNELVKALAIFWGCLREKPLFTLKSVQLLAENQHNDKSGDFMRGCEVPPQNRFELFPASFDTSSMCRGFLPCTWLESAAIHEATHVCLEPRLKILWDADLAALGYRKTPPGCRIRLRSGGTTDCAMTDPRRVPTTYCLQQMDDDRAESAVAYLIGWRLDPERARRLSKIFDLEGGERARYGHCTDLPPLPSMIEPVFHLARGATAEDCSFASNGGAECRELKFLTLEEFWELTRQQ
ncbi:MAG: hypothetical protein WC641_01290 [Patescibacteria group bacterium]